MPSESSIHLFKQASLMAQSLYCITITDAWYHEGGNIKVASRASQSHSMSAVLAGIVGSGGVGALRGVGQAIRQDRDTWIAQGKKTLGLREGVCTDCAAAASVSFLEIVDESNYEASVEIISSTTHAFVVVNRNATSSVREPRTWGDDCFVIDVWYQNQFKMGATEGAFWANGPHPVAKFIDDNAYRLRLEATMRSPIESICLW